MEDWSRAEKYSEALVPGVGEYLPNYYYLWWTWESRTAACLSCVCWILHLLRSDSHITALWGWIGHQSCLCSAWVWMPRATKVSSQPLHIDTAEKPREIRESLWPIKPDEKWQPFFFFQTSKILWHNITFLANFLFQWHQCHINISPGVLSFFGERENLDAEILVPSRHYMIQGQIGQLMLSPPHLTWLQF